jgi:hypothetical protein
MFGWERRSIIRDGCDLASLGSWGEEVRGYRYLLLTDLTLPTEEGAGSPAAGGASTTPSARQRRLKKARALLKCRRPERPTGN